MVSHLYAALRDSRDLVFVPYSHTLAASVWLFTEVQSGMSVRTGTEFKYFVAMLANIISFVGVLSHMTGEASFSCTTILTPTACKWFLSASIVTVWLLTSTPSHVVKRFEVK